MGKLGRCLAYGAGEITCNESISGKNEPTLCSVKRVIVGKSLKRNIVERILLEAESF